LKLGDVNGLPSIEQVIEGMYGHFSGKVNFDCKGLDYEGIILVVDGFRNIFDLLYQCMKDTNFKKPLTGIDLINPHNPFV